MPTSYLTTEYRKKENREGKKSRSEARRKEWNMGHGPVMW